MALTSGPIYPFGGRGYRMRRTHYGQYRPLGYYAQKQNLFEGRRYGKKCCFFYGKVKLAVWAEHPI